MLYKYFYMSEAVSHGTIFSGGRIMLEHYINRILTMGALADSVTIIDDRQIIRYFQPFNPNIVPFQASDVVGTHFRSAFLDVDPDESGVLKALHGEATLSETYTQQEDLPDLIGNSPAMQKLKHKLLRVAQTDANVLICGETGSGKELVAQALHTASRRNQRLFYPQNCAAIPATLLESTFFGSEKGAYTGSVQSKGILEQADGGTVFLDEINSLDLSVQAKLLRALEDKRIRRLGGTKEIQSDFRIISAMNEDPFDCMRSGKIRSDLFFRLSTVILEVPPLRHRREDIPLLADFFIKKFCPQGPVKTLTPNALAILCDYNWPRNVRELKNAIEYACIFAEGPEITPKELPDHIIGMTSAISFSCPNNIITDISSSGTLKTLMDQYEADLLSERVAACKNHSRLARELGVTRQTLLNKLSKYGLL